MCVCVSECGICMDGAGDASHVENAFSVRDPHAFSDIFYSRAYLGGNTTVMR